MFLTFLYGLGIREKQKREIMTLTINTNLASITAQRSLTNATNALNTAIERMSTGYKVNHASDNAAAYSIIKQWTTQLTSLDIAADNAAMGVDMIKTAEDNYDLLNSYMQRVRDLTEQAANGTYGSASLKAIQAEIASRLTEINRMAASAEFNGIKLMAYTSNGDGSGITSAGVNIQVGINDDTSSRINLASSLFANANMTALAAKMTGTASGGKTLAQIVTAAGGSISDLTTDANINAFAAACAGLVYDSSDGSFTMQSDSVYGPAQMLGFLDMGVAEISSRVTKLGAAENQVSSAVDLISVQSENLTSSLSTLRDTDIAKESSNYIQAQILQQASATLLATANQAPSIALNLI